MNWTKVLAVIGDLEDVITTGVALVSTTTSLQSQFDVLKNDVAVLVTNPSFDNLSMVVTDTKVIVTDAEALLGPNTPEVVAFKSAVYALELEFTSK